MAVSLSIHTDVICLSDCPKIHASIQGFDIISYKGHTLLVVSLQVI
jgi:hypothetical protein